jgi:DNA-binding transcriptional MerR regulator
MGEAEPLYGIGVVALRLGLSPTRLRQLERRQVLPRPRRLASGQRLYTEGDIALLRARLDARRSVCASALVA